MNVQSTLQWLDSHEVQGYALLGFDTFVDRICRRVSGLGGDAVRSMTDLGQRLINRQEHSGLVALNEVETRLGGNMPNTANVLSELGAPVSCIGAFGMDEINRTFSGLAGKCRMKSYADPGTCLAIEFDHCKLFLGENGVMDDIRWETILERIGREYILEQFRGAKLVGLFNWGEILSTQRIWEGLLRDILPHVNEGKRRFFFDFSDMSGRSRDEIRQMLATLAQFRQYGKVIVSLNSGERETLNGMELLEEHLADALVLHTAAQSTLLEGGKRRTLKTRLTEQPAILTGCGDSFNAGFCYGMLQELSLEDCLKTANATAGCYVRNGTAPSKKEMMEEIQKCEELWK